MYVEKGLNPYKVRKCVGYIDYSTESYMMYLKKYEIKKNEVGKTGQEKK